MSWLGIDVGTSGVKAAAVNRHGRIIALAKRRCALKNPAPGRYEINPLEVWAAVQAAVAEVALGCEDDPVEALCVSSLGESFVLLDARGRELSDCPMFYDQRGAQELEALLLRVSGARWLSHTGIYPATQQTLPKLMCLLKERPELLASAKRLHFLADYVLYKLGGPHVTDGSLASTSMMLKLDALDWWGEALDCLALDRGVMPRVHPAGTDLGAIEPDVARTLGLSLRVRLVLGGHDQMMCAIGAGVFDARAAANSMGTTDAVTPVITGAEPASRVLSGVFRLTPYSALPGRCYSSVYNLNGGALNEWFSRTFYGVQATEDAFLELEPLMPDDPTSITFLPDFSGGNGSVLGLTYGADRPTIYKALLEGQAFEIKREMDRFEAHAAAIVQIRAMGGAARSDKNLQLRADIWNKQVCRLASNEAGVLGCAMVAGKAMGALSDLEAAASEVVKVARVFEPDARAHALYLERYAAYLEEYKRHE